MTFSQAIMQLLFDTKLVSSDLSAHNKMQRKGAPTFDQVEVAWHEALVVPGVVLRPTRSRRGAAGRGRCSGRSAHPWATPSASTTSHSSSSQMFLHLCNQIIHLHVV